MALITIAGYSGPPIDGALTADNLYLDNLATPARHRLLAGGEVRVIRGPLITTTTVGTTTTSGGYVTLAQANSLIATALSNFDGVRRVSSLPTTASYIGEPVVLIGTGLFEATNLTGSWQEVSSIGASFSTYRHDQTTASSTWTINHNLGRDVEVSVFTIGGVEMIATVIQISLNQVQVTFDSPYDGYALVQ